MTAVADGQGALEAGSKVSPDLVIIDASLGDGDGASFIQPLRNLLNKPELPVIMLSGDRKGSDALYSAESTATDYLAKPFSPPMLRARVRAWLARTMTFTAHRIESIAAESNPLESGQKTADQDGASPATAEALASGIPVFSSLSKDHLANLLRRSTEYRYPPGHTVIRQDDSGESVYVILSGRVRVLESVPDTPVEMFLEELGPGEIFGELGALRERPRAANVITVERTRCLAIPSQDFLGALQNSKEMSLTLLRILAGRLYDADRLLARHAPDPLTGLPGRRAFHELYRRLAVAKRKDASIVLLLLDVLHLKEINDRFGYHVGDDVLRTVADALLESSRGTDLVARYGGDEFAVLLVEATTDDADGVLSRVRQKLHALAIYRGLPLTVECRFGHAVSDNPPETAEELFHLANDDLQAKRTSQTK
jgi:diguanylate cyclase (GGDEF)-like protein